MKIWKYGDDVTDYAMLTFPNIKRDETETFDGRSQREHWPSTREAVWGVGTDNMPLGNNIPFPFSMKGLDDKALNCLLPLIEKDVEVLPAKLGEMPVHLVNTTTVLDCIDYEKSQYQRYTPNGRIMLFMKYVFHPERVGNHHIFKLVDEPRRSPFVTEAFVKCVEENQLTGFIFKLVWDTEVDIPPRPIW